MARPLSKALADLRDGFLQADFQAVLDADRLLFPECRPLAPHQRRLAELLHTRQIILAVACRGAGKTHVAARYELLRQVFVPTTVIMAAPSYRQAKLPWTEQRDLILHGGLWAARFHAKDAEGSEKALLQLRNGSLTVAVPASGALTHGYHGQVLIVDELAQGYPKALFLRTTRPMIATKRRRADLNQVVVLTTAGWQHDFAFEWMQSVLAAIDRGDRRYGFWSATLDELEAEGYGYIDYAMAREDRKFDEDIYEQQWQNRWLAHTEGFYDSGVVMRESIRTADLLREARPGMAYTVGFDYARGRKAGTADSACIALEIDPEKRTASIAWAERWHGLTAPQQAKELDRILRRFRASKLVADRQGGGQSVLDELAALGWTEPGAKAGRRVVLDFPVIAPTITAAHHVLRGMFEDGTIRTPRPPEDDDLVKAWEDSRLTLKQLADLQADPAGRSGSLSFSAPHGRHKDLADALLYAAWGTREFLGPQDAPKQDRGSPVVSAGRLARALAPGAAKANPAEEAALDSLAEEGVEIPLPDDFSDLSYAGQWERRWGRNRGRPRSEWIAPPSGTGHGYGY